MIMNHYRTIRSKARFQKCLIRVYIESNSSFICSDRIANELRNAQHLIGGNISVVRFDTKGSGRFGIWTTNDKKEAYVYAMQRDTPRAQFVFDDEWCSSQKPAKLKAALYRQLKNYRKDVQSQKSDGASSKPFPTVRYTGKSVGETDDLALLWGMLLHHMWFDIYQNNEFSEYCATHKWVPLSN